MDGERYSIRQIEELRAKNMELVQDNENQRRQIRAQDDAIVQAQALKEKTDIMLSDYEKIRQDLAYHMQKNEEILKELDHQKAERYKAEDESRAAKAD